MVDVEPQSQRDLADSKFRSAESSERSAPLTVLSYESVQKYGASQGLLNNAGKEYDQLK
jgi:hypothetical protein